MKRSSPNVVARPTKSPKLSVESLDSDTDPYYVVRVGRIRGIYRTWEDCKSQVERFPGATFKKCYTKEYAEKYLAFVDRPGWTLVDKSIVPIDLLDQLTPSVQGPIISIETEAAIKVINKARKFTQPLEVVVYTDGACKGNGTKEAKAGIGIYIQREGETPSVEYKAAPLMGDRQTNQRAEMMAALVGLKMVARDLERVGKIKLVTDSKHVVNGMTSWMIDWKKGGWVKELVNKDLWRKLDRQAEELKEKGIVVTWVWVKGHSGVPGNEKADELATEGCTMHDAYETRSVIANK
jgi:ribonuclease HI